MFVIVLMTLLLVKHFWLDFWWQPPFMWQNKGTFGHWGGIVHSGLHAIATFFILAAILFLGGVGSVLLLFVLPVIEFVLHYTIDWCKMNLNKKMGWTATTHNEFWQLTGFDQLLHQLTYIAIAVAIILA